MKKFKRFKQSYLDIGFNHVGMYWRKRDPIFLMLNHGAYLCRYY